MARTDARFRQAHNAVLGMFTRLPADARLPSEVQLAADLGVSRTVVRSVLQKLAEDGILAGSGRERRVVRAPRAKDRLPLRDEYISRDELEARFLDWVLRFDVPAGTALNITQLSRQFHVPTHLLQEFLASLGQSGLIERRARGGWRLLGFTAEYAVELSDFRQVLELNAVRSFAALPADHSAWALLDRIRIDHLDLLARIERDFHDFSRLDGQFHALINSVVTNRFVAEFQKVISLIFHYHYQWDKTMERFRNEAAIREHLTIIAALQARDAPAAEGAARSHLSTSKETLLSSMRGHHLV
ncbi:MAG: GntR family transcriptional regulator [Paracoccaceae bacterium]